MAESSLPFPRLDTPEGRAALWGYIVEQRGLGAMPGTPDMLFLGMAVARYGSSWSQLLQDLYVLWKLRQRRGGFFVEFGALDGLKLSNTALLEFEFGWTGILAEPNPRMREPLARNRRAKIDFRAVTGRTGATMPFSIRRDLPDLSSVGHSSRAANAEIVDVQTVSLGDLLAQHEAPQIIDYLSIDTEGSEAEILAAFDFSRRFRIVSVEHNFDAAKRSAIYELLTAHGYTREFEHFSRWDDWYFDHRLMP